MSEPLIEVEIERLTKILGLDEWPEYDGRPFCLNNNHQRMAARVLTDAFQPYKVTGKIHPDIAIHNATHWIDMAYDGGKRAGIEMERKAWQKKIRKMFDLP